MGRRRMNDHFLRRRFTTDPSVAPAKPADPYTRVSGVVNILCGIKIVPKGGKMLSTVQTSLIELRCSLIFDGVPVEVEIESEWIYFQPDVMAP